MIYYPCFFLRSKILTLTLYNYQGDCKVQLPGSLTVNFSEKQVSSLKFGSLNEFLELPGSFCRLSTDFAIALL
jgi:hypothetical protein